MKRTISLAIAFIMILSTFLLTACGGNSNSNVDLSDSKYVGTWAVSEASLKGQSEAADFEWTLILNGDGTAQMVDEDGTTDLTWTLTKDGFKTGGGTKLTFTDEGDKIKTKVMNVDIIFEKQA